MEITELQIKKLEHIAIQIEKDALIDDDVSGGHLPEPYKEAVNTIYQIIEQCSDTQTPISKKEDSPLNNVMSTLLKIHKMLEIDYEEQTLEDQNTISSIVEMCDNIKEDYWMYKREELDPEN